ncbi:MAG: hypothetical protein KHZ62_00700 [Clostridiales bacterium]|nr:hypothetical protein [Clostridiales bacterium]
MCTGGGSLGAVFFWGEKAAAGAVVWRGEFCLFSMFAKGVQPLSLFQGCDKIKEKGEERKNIL